MKRFIEVAVFVLLAGVCITLLLLMNSEEEQGFKFSEGPEISLRNATQTRIYYGIKPNNTFDLPEKKVIKPKEIHRYNSRFALEISW